MASTAKAIDPKARLDDMDDSEEIQSHDRKLGPFVEALKVCQREIFPYYLDADESAKAQQKTYRWLARGAAVMGTFAVILAISQLGKFSNSEPLTKWLGKLEVAMALGAAAIVVYGIGNSTQKRWLLCRYQAERLRLLKFEFLTRPALWSDLIHGGVSGRNLSDEVHHITKLSFPSIELWAGEATPPFVRPAPVMPPEIREEFRRYYEERRLTFQLNYMSGAAERYKKSKLRFWIVPPVIFFLSILFVALHFAVEWIPGEGPEYWSKVLMAIAAALPVIGAGIRIYQGAFELGRHASRFESSGEALVKIRRRLQDADSADAIFREIGFAEHVLEADNREWMRVMADAEWFG